MRAHTTSHTQYNLAIEKEKRNNNKYANPLTRILISDRILHKTSDKILKWNANDIEFIKEIIFAFFFLVMELRSWITRITQKKSEIHKHNLITCKNTPIF